MDTYEKQANNFLLKTNTKFKCEFLKFDKHFSDDKAKRDIYQITLTRGERKYTFEFGQSISRSQQWIAKSIHAKNIWLEMGCPRLMGKTLREVVGFRGHSTIKGDFVKNENFSEPTAYDVLACLTKYDPDSFENFCLELGYNSDSKKHEEIYESVKQEWQNVAMLWNDEELEELRDIQ